MSTVTILPSPIDCNMEPSLPSTTASNEYSEQKGRKRELALVSDCDTGHGEDDDGKQLAESTDKKWKRVMANRLSAKESRERRKKLLTGLEGSVQILSKENSILAAENAELRKHISLLLPHARANMTLAYQAQLQLTTQKASPDLLLTMSLRPTLADSLSRQHSRLNAGLLRQQMKLYGLDVGSDQRLGK